MSMGYRNGWGMGFGLGRCHQVSYIFGPIGFPLKRREAEEKVEGKKNGDKWG